MKPRRMILSILLVLITTMLAALPVTGATTLDLTGATFERGERPQRTDYLYPANWTQPTDISEFNIWIRSDGTGKIRVLSSEDHDRTTVRFTGGIEVRLHRQRAGFYTHDLSAAQVNVLESGPPTAESNPVVPETPVVKTINLTGITFERGVAPQRTDYLYPAGWTRPTDVSELNIWVRSNNSGKLRVNADDSYDGATVTIGAVSGTLVRQRSGFFYMELTEAQVRSIEAGPQPATESTDRDEPPDVTPPKFTDIVPPVEKEEPAIAERQAEEGQPTIRGTVQTGETLSVDTSTITDNDGIPSDVTYTYQWFWRFRGSRSTVWFPIPASDGGTHSTFTISLSESSVRFRIEVSFTDSGGNAEQRTSPQTDWAGFRERDAEWPQRSTTLTLTPEFPTTNRTDSTTGIRYRDLPVPPGSEVKLTFRRSGAADTRQVGFYRVTDTSSGPTRRLIFEPGVQELHLYAPILSGVTAISAVDSADMTPKSGSLELRLRADGNKVAPSFIVTNPSECTLELRGKETCIVPEGESFTVTVSRGEFTAPGCTDNDSATPCNQTYFYPRNRSLTIELEWSNYALEVNSDFKAVLTAEPPTSVTIPANRTTTTLRVRTKDDQYARPRIRRGQVPSYTHVVGMSSRHDELTFVVDDNDEGGLAFRDTHLDMGMPNQTNYAYVVKLKSKPTHDVWVKISNILYNAVDGNGAQYNKQRIPDDIVVHSPVVSTGGTGGNEEARWLKFTPTDWNSWKSIVIQWQRAPIGICNSGNGWRCTNRYIVLDTYSNDGTYGVSLPETLHFTFTPPDPFRDDAATNLDTDGPTITSIEVDAPDPAAAIWAGQDVTVKTGQPTVSVDKNVRVKVTFSENVKMIQSNHDGYGRPYMILHMTNRARTWTRKAFLDKISSNNVAEFYYRLDDRDRGTNYWLRIESRSGPTQKISVGMNAIRLRPGTNIVADTTDATPANLMHASTSRAVIPASWWNYIARGDSETPVTSDERLRSLISIQGPVVTEGTDTNASIRIFLDLAANAPFTVDYATEDHTACSGETPYGGRCSAESGKDYTKKSGTVSFAEGDTEKTIEIAIADDMVDEGKEFFFVRLSNVSSSDAAAIAHDGLGVVTIKNSDPMPKAWLARFGRTAATHVLDAVEERLQEPASASWVRLGGHEVGGVAPDVMETARSLAPEQRLWDEVSTADPTGQDMTLDELLLGSAFHLVSNPEQNSLGPRLSAWGRVATSGFDGGEGHLTLTGTVTTATLGVDGVFRRWLTGVAVAYSDSEGSFTHTEAPGGSVTSTLTSIHPYVGYALSDRVKLWGLVGYGSGSLELALGDRHLLRTDLDMTMGALGIRGTVLSTAAGLELAIRSDVLWVSTGSAATPGMVQTESDTNRLRLVLEGSRPFSVAGGGTFTPTLELGLRRDGGDAEEGSGVEVGGRLRYASASGLNIEVALRALVAHEASDYQEWGASGALRYDPGQAGVGLTASITPTWGMASSGVGRLWSQPDARGLAGGGGLSPSAAARVDAELGWGLRAMKGRGLLTPYARASLVEGSEHAWHLGTRLALAESLNLSLEATHRQRLDDAAAHELALLATVPW